MESRPFDEKVENKCCDKCGLMNWECAVAVAVDAAGDLFAASADEAKWHCMEVAQVLEMSRLVECGNVIRWQSVAMTCVMKYAMFYFFNVFNGIIYFIYLRIIIL